MLVVSRFDVNAAPDSAGAAFLSRAEGAVAAMSTRPGYLSSRIARAVDEPAVWVLITEWESVGTYRRAMGAFDVRIAAAQLLGEARDEPSTFEVLGGEPDHPRSSSDRAE